MKTPSDISTILIRLFDYQKYNPAPSLTALCDQTADAYGTPLSDEVLSMIHAAGEAVPGNLYPQTRRIQDEQDYS